MATKSFDTIISIDTIEEADRLIKAFDLAEKRKPLPIVEDHSKDIEYLDEIYGF